MTFASTITKEEVIRMPLERFAGQIVIVETKEALIEAISCLSSSKVIGFDTETRPNFTKDSHHRLSLMQLANHDTCFLIRLNNLKWIPSRLVTFLNNRKIKKIGLSLQDDFLQLRWLSYLPPDIFIDLQKYVSNFGIEELSLRKIYALLFGKRISKRQQKSNWDALTLSDDQMNYAALDAWSCLRIYQYLEQSR